MGAKYPEIVRGDDAYWEIRGFLGSKTCNRILIDSVTQISGRWLKGSVFVSDIYDPAPMELNPDGSIKTRRQRFRIPKTSWLARRKRVAA